MKVSNDFSTLDHERIILSSDGGPAIKSLKEAIQTDSSKNIKLSHKLGELGYQILKEESAAYCIISNGYFRIHQLVHSGQVRTMKLRSRIDLVWLSRMIIPVPPWMARHVDFIKYRHHVDGTLRTIYA